MSSTLENDPRSEKAKNVNFSDLERILRKTLGDENLKLVDYTPTNFMPLGENFCSLMVKLDITICKKNSTDTEKLYLVAKTNNSVESPILNWVNAFKREVFMYSELLPAYKELEKKVGVPENEVINVLPKYYGHRNTLKEDSNEIDNDSLFLMENMKEYGYYVGNKKVGLNKDHASLLLKALARYHALGIALKHKRPEFFKKIFSFTKVKNFDCNWQQLNDGFNALLKNFQEDPCFSKYLPSIEESFAQSMDGKRYLTPGQEPWLTVTHGDLWVNNVLFHADENGQADDVKFIDFQGYLCNSPLIDVARFLFASLEATVMRNNIDELLDIYYDNFITTLKRMGCNVEPYNRKSFEEELKKQSIGEFPLCSMSKKFHVWELKDEKDSEEVMNNIFSLNCNDKVKSMILEVVKIFEERGYF